MRIVERPIPTYYGDEICHVNGIPYAVNCMLTSWQFYKNRKANVMSYPGPLDVPRIANEEDKYLCYPLKNINIVGYLDKLPV